MRRLALLFLLGVFLLTASFQVFSQTSDPILVGAGDIADCQDLTGAKATAALLDSIPGTVFTAGDDAYPDGTDSNFNHCYDVTWGRFRSRTMPALGNHEYNIPNGMEYYNYFGPNVGTPRQGWYSYNLGTWHIVVLNSNCGDVGCDTSSAQYTWLVNDLAANPTACSLAIWHHPLFCSSSGTTQPAMASFWQALANAHAELVIAGHAHIYERFGPQNALGQADLVNGIVEMVVCSGGESHGGFDTIQPNSLARADSTYGVMQFTLHPTSYDFQFVHEAGATFTDSGTIACH